MLAFFKGSSGGVTYSGLSTTETKFLPNTQFDVMAAFIANYGLRNFAGTIALALVGEYGDVKEFISREYAVSKLEAMDGNSGSMPGSGYSLTCTITKTPESGDRIWLMYRANDVETWSQVKGGRDVTTEIVVKAGGTGLKKTEQNNISNVIVTNDNNRIFIKSPVTMTMLMIYDIKGQLQKAIECPENVEFNFSCEDYDSGIYILKVITTEGVSSAKFIKN